VVERSARPERKDHAAVAAARMKRQPSVLIVSASAGTGHLAAANALMGAFAERHPDLHAEHVDLLRLAPAWVRAVYSTGFEVVAARAPRLWKGIYLATDGTTHDAALWAPAAERLLFRSFRRLLRVRSWDLCLSTHFLPCQLGARRPGFPPFEMVVTDFELHRIWVQRGVRRYFVATEAMAAELRGRLPRVQVLATGIPISPAVANAPPCGAARAELGLPLDRRIVLIAGGGLGIGVEESALAALEGAPADVLLIAVCGRNQAARERLAGLRVAPERLQVHGYLSGLVPWMAAADLIATKPGGLSVSEALALGRPLRLTRPIPGAEEGNTRAVTAEGAALAARTTAEMRAAFARAFGEPGLLEGLSEAARRIGRADAAARVADAVAERVRG